jgi:glucoamylase
MRRLRLLAVVAVGVVSLTVGLPAVAGASGAPGAPGAAATWTPADKHGFGTATSLTSKVWFSLEHGELTDVFYPDLGTPGLRDLQLIVTDGKTFADLERDATTSRVRLLDPRSLTYQQVNTAISGRYRITKTYATDPTRSTLLADLTVESLTGAPYQFYAYVDPSLTNNGMDDSGTCGSGRLLASDGATASALIASRDFAQTSCGYLGTSDGWTDLRSDHAMDWHYPSATNGNVVETARLKLNGTGQQHATLALGFAGTTSAALSAAQASLASGFPAVSSAYAAGWHDYLSSLKPPPASLTTAGQRTTYDVSRLVLAAHEDKTYRGAFVASPTMPWVWGTGLENPSGAYHLVWSRDLYQIATALLAEGDTAAAGRALTYLFDRQQKPDGSFPQNSTVDGTPHWTNVQLDEVADPIILAWMLHRTDGSTYQHVQKAADYILANGPSTPQERWENQGGYSPATIAAEIAGLVCAADLARANNDTRSATTYLTTADAWQKAVKGWTVTTNGPLASSPYFLRLTKDASPNAGTVYNIGDSGPDGIDQRAVVDPSFLELVRLGVLPATDPDVVATLPVIDAQLGVPASKPQFWHRYNRDGYGEQPDGRPWDIGFPPAPLNSPWSSQATIGRIWPIFAGERGEYELAAGQSAAARLAAMAATANDGYLLPEQVWDAFPPSGSDGFAPMTGTFSATPLAWSHAQFIRLAWSITAGAPVEQPSIVACRYVKTCQ